MPVLAPTVVTIADMIEMVRRRPSSAQPSLVSAIRDHRRLFLIGVAWRADRFEPLDPVGTGVEVTDPREQCLLEHRRREILTADVVRNDAEGNRDKVVIVWHPVLLG